MHRIHGRGRAGSAGKKTAVVSTINGDANVPFYKELANQGIEATDIPVLAFSVGEQELAGIDTGPLVGHLAAWNYFMSVETEQNWDFIDAWGESSLRAEKDMLTGTLSYAGQRAAMGTMVYSPALRSGMVTENSIRAGAPSRVAFA